MKEFGVIKIFGASAWHDNVKIIGNKIGLEKLKSALDKALKEEYNKEDFMETDGEGYDIEIMLHDYTDDSDEWIKFPIHYHDEIASEKDNSKWSYMNEILTKKSKK